jgi:predicted protein tyrosine phosphatase
VRLIVGPERRWREALVLAPDAEMLLLRAPGAADDDPVPRGRSLGLHFNDIAAPRPHLVAPDAVIMERILAFGRRARDVAVLCYAGVSRSTAAAYALACQASAPGEEDRLARRLRRLSPAATPNTLMIALADAALGRDGRMVCAIAAIGRGADAFEGGLFEWRVGPGAPGD